MKTKDPLPKELEEEIKEHIKENEIKFEKALKEYSPDHKFSKKDMVEVCNSTLEGSMIGTMKAFKAREKEHEAEIKEKEKIVELAIKSVEQYRHADDENDKWRKKHKHWGELNKIVTNKEHLQVESLYNKASDTMDRVIEIFKEIKSKHSEKE